MITEECIRCVLERRRFYNIKFERNDGWWEYIIEAKKYGTVWVGVSDKSYVDALFDLIREYNAR